MGIRVVALDRVDRAAIHEVVNAAASAYRGEIPDAADTDPYVPMGELSAEMGEMAFFGAVDDRLVGVIGLQERPDVTLIRHLYVRPERQREGIGSRLLAAGIDRADSDTLLVGTLAAANWAIAFYGAHGFSNLGDRDDLLAAHWDVPEHQMDASVVLRYEG